ncbi:MAG TPA: hypothetical protein VHA35_19730 [Dongiaceae bacterium]|jgi:hypothetical protein|nr:hypothetical protein [Dongiaceae bacterium]
MAENGPETPNPNAPPKVEDLARRIMDLWQEQMAAIAADPDLMRQMARMMAASPFPAMIQGVVAGMMAAPRPEATQAGLGGANPYEWWKGADGQSKQPASAPAPAQTGAAPAAAASEPGGGDLAELRRHLAGLEARLKELGGGELGAEPARPGAKPKRPARKPAAKVGGAVPGGGENGSGGAGGGAPG